MTRCIGLVRSSGTAPGAWLESGQERLPSEQLGQQNRISVEGPFYRRSCHGKRFQSRLDTEDGESHGSNWNLDLPAAPRRFSALKNPDNVKCSFFGQGINCDSPGRASADDGNTLDGDHAFDSPRNVRPRCLHKLPVKEALQGRLLNVDETFSMWSVGAGQRDNPPSLHV